MLNNVPAALLVLAACVSQACASQSADSAKPAATSKPIAAVPAQPVAAVRPQPAATVPAAQAADTSKAAGIPAAAAPDPRRDSAVARQYKIGNRPFSREDMKRHQAALGFSPFGKPESSSVILLYRDRRGATLGFEGAKSEWAFAFDSVPFLGKDEYLPDSLIRTRTDPLLRNFLKEKAGQYAFVNYEVTLVQERDTALKEGAKPAVPAYYIGRYLRKLDGRYVLGDAFQVRIGVGRANALSFLSYRDPALTDSSLKVKVPTREMVEEYLAKWARQPERLGRRYYPYHPDKLRIRKLKPVKVFESYVLIQQKFRDNPSKDGTYLAPRITVLAEADLAASTKKLRAPQPAAPVLLHFHFPCTPGAGLCWPDGKQEMEAGPYPDIGPRPAVPPPAGTAPPAGSPKSGAATEPARTLPAKP